jgi:glycosyltransferase involved in cell wall biosynthesis
VLLGRRSRARVVITEHYTGFQRGLISGYDKLTARLAFRAVDLVAAVTEDLAQHVTALAPHTRVEVVENVVDTEVFRPGARAGGGREGSAANQPARLLTVGALAEKKGHAYLLEALALLPERDRLTLEVVGDGEERAALEALTQRLGLDEMVRFRGELPKEDVAQLMRGADLFVLPSLVENLPCVLIEAMASGLPAVASAVGGVPALLDGTGVLCPPADAHALGQAISTALSEQRPLDPDALAERARLRFGYEAFERTWSKLYAELLNRG